ncbi:hypothetical protein AAG906_005396 [Vitis piasezkii]
MYSEFEMSMMGKLNFFLGLQIKQLKEGTFINQAKYIKDLLKRFNMEEAKVMKTPMSSFIKLDMDEKGKSIDSTMYRGMIGSLLYLTASRPDIMYSVCLCARFQSCPKESHLSVIKRILRYLKRTMNISLWYPKGDNFELIGFSDADFAGCRVERKSTSGTCHFLGHSLVSWHSKKQNSVALSMAKRIHSSRSISRRLGFRVCGCIFLSAFILCLDSFFTSFTSLMAPRRETGTSRAQGKRPVEPSQPEQTEARRKARSVNFSQLQHFGFEGLFGRMGWLPVVMISESVFPTLVRAFYSRATYGLGGPVLSTMRGVEIRLSPESICSILDIPSVGLRVYEAKAWPTVPGFEPREVVQSLTVTSQVLHHMICSILLPREGH